MSPPARTERHETTMPSSDASAEQELIMYLEPDQLVVETDRPVPRAQLGHAARVGLWALRVFVVVISLMVIYTFIERLH